MNKKRKLLIFYDWFYPGFRAGGPIQSLMNLTVNLLPEFEIYVITGSSDLNSKDSYQGVVINTWNEVRLPNSEGTITVFYSSKETLNKAFITSLIAEVNPGTVYLNGIFSYRFFLLPLLALRKNQPHIRTVICPRGMLKKGALEGKSLKKKLYLFSIKRSGLLDRVKWHATTSEEARDITGHFPVNAGVVVAPNIPKCPFGTIPPINKVKGELKLVYLSLINEHKNLDLLLQSVKAIGNTQISLDIYGPVVGKPYWSRCEAIIKQLPGNVHYRGEVEPPRVQQLLSQYHSAVLLTKGENFGHALYESLSVGRPVMTSNFTPWQNLHEVTAGANLDIANLGDCVSKIREFLNMEQEEYRSFCKGAYSVAKDYYSNLGAEVKYKHLFCQS